MNSHVSVVITTYNWPGALSLVLSALEIQTYKNFEVIIADDGSDKRTEAVIEKAKFTSNFPIQHVWQEDQGFKAGRIRNQAVKKSVGDYLIFLDGDCIPRQNFLAKHIFLREHHWFVRGNRIMLSQAFTQQILDENLPIFLWNNTKWISHRTVCHINRFLPLISLPDFSLRKLKSLKWHGVKTCNLGIWRTDFEYVGGLDECYIGWGREDSDLAVRLINAGIRRKEGIYSTAVFHLWHKELSRNHLANNDNLLNESIQNNRVKATHGLCK